MNRGVPRAGIPGPWGRRSSDPHQAPAGYLGAMHPLELEACRMRFIRGVITVSVSSLPRSAPSTPSAISLLHSFRPWRARAAAPALAGSLESKVRRIAQLRGRLADFSSPQAPHYHYFLALNSGGRCCTAEGSGDKGAGRCISCGWRAGTTGLTNWSDLRLGWQLDKEAR